MGKRGPAKKPADLQYLHGSVPRRATALPPGEWDVWAGFDVAAVDTGAETCVLTRYADDVLSGRIPSGRLHRRAAERHRADVARIGMAGWPWELDMVAAARCFHVVGQHKHFVGQWAGRPILLEPWQQFVLGSILAWRHQATKQRRYRTAYIEIPRKSGKSTMAAVLAEYLTFYEPGADGVPHKGQATYIVATKLDQAKIVFGYLAHIIRISSTFGPGGSKRSARPLSGPACHLDVQQHNMARRDSYSKLEPLGSDRNSTDGLNPSLVIVDEFHAHRDRGLIDVMETAMGARAEPLSFQITTAGDDPISPCGDQHDYAAKVLTRVLDDERFFGFVTHADEEDDWTSEATWRKANPNYGVIVQPEYLADLCLKATHMPAAAAAFQQKLLNLWVHSSAPCLSVDGWRRGQSDWAESEMEGQACYVGVDLASKLDLMAVSFVFPPAPGRGWRLIQRIWTPAETLADRAHRDRAPYAVWAAQGWLTACPGVKMDASVVRDAIVWARGRFEILQVGFDPWHADTPIQQLITEDGFSALQVVEVPQSASGMSAGCMEMQAQILAGAVDARRCPVTAWAVSNAVGVIDGKGNLMFSKDPKKSKGRIDPLIAATIGVTMWKRRTTAPAVVLGELTVL